MNNVSEVVKSDLCVGCGVCMDVCPKNCIQINHGVVNNPTVWEQDCVACGKCLKACPGKGVEIEKLSESFFAGEGIIKDSHIGYYHKCFSGYSNEYARYMAWAKACQDDSPLESDYSFLSNSLFIKLHFENSGEIMLIIISISAASLLMFITLLIIKKRKHK